MSRSDTGGSKRTVERNMAKCQFCRLKKIKCYPHERDWSKGEKCEPCVRGGQPCGPNERFPLSTDRNSRVRDSSEPLAGTHFPNLSEGRALSDPMEVMNGQGGRMQSVLPIAPTKSKRAHAEISSDNIWTETPLRPGYGIRLLRLYGGAPDAPLEGRLILSDGKEPYEALSYGGEQEHNKSSINLVSARPTRKFEIKSSLAGALRELRYADKYRLLWINSICINQEDVDERNAHAQRMGKIFNNASNVCLWLGSANSDSTAAFQFLEKVANDSGFHTQLTDNDRNSLSMVLELLKRPFFTRCWILQETALAKKATLRCGSDIIRWDQFTDAIALLTSRVLPPRIVGNIDDRTSDEWGARLASTAGYWFVDASSNLFRKSDEGTILGSLLSLESLVCHLSRFETSLVHDNIYAFLSLAEDTGYNVRPVTSISTEADNEGILSRVLSAEEQERARKALVSWRDRVADSDYPIDYTKPVIELCRDFIEFATHQSGSLDILVRPWAPVKYRAQLPSWVATLAGRAFQEGIHHRTQADPLVGPAGSHRKVYSATRKYPRPSITVGQDADHKSLFVEGCILDSIKLQASPAHDGNIPLDWVALAAWNDISDPCPERFWRTLVANRTSDGSNPPRYFGRACEYIFRRQHYPPNHVITEVSHDQLLPTAEYLTRVRSVIWLRRMIETEQEQLLGLAPEQAEEGDLICILFGCSVPVVLRKVVKNARTGDHEYLLIGECYIHGMMDGEAYVMKGARNIFTTSFEIK